MVRFRSRLKTFIFCTFLLALIAIIAMLYYSLRYSYTSTLEIKYLGTLNLKIEKDFVASDVPSANSSHTNSSMQASGKVYLPQEGSRSKNSDQTIKAEVSEIENKSYRNITSKSSLTNHSANGSVAIDDNHKQNSSIVDEAKSGVANGGGNTVKDLGEISCPKSPSKLGES